jgi:hypothetical protein
MGTAATYLYAVTRRHAALDLPGARGVADEQLRMVDDDAELACVVGSVDLDEFGEAALARNLEDIAWLERVARRHDAVVRAVAEQTATVPLRLGVICHDDESARQALRDLGSRARELLERIEGREEWGLKLYAAPEAQAASPDPPPSGTAYLQRRKLALAERDQVAEQAQRDAEAIYGRLAEQAHAARRHRPQDQRLTGSPTPMVLNAAFLVDRTDRDAFRAVADELAVGRSADTFVVTGPWPPYSFASLEEEQ